MSSSFDPETFMHSEVEGKMEVTFTPVPEGEFGAYIDDIEAASVETKNGPAPVLYVTYAITDEEVKEQIDLDHPTVRQTVWLDFDDSGALSFSTNKNVRLGRIREATGQNVDGEPWSPSMLKGAGPVTVKVGHRYNSETGEGPYADVQRVVAG